MAEEDIKMDMEKILSLEGEEKWFKVIIECIDAKIELYHAEAFTPGIKYPIKEERVKKAEEALAITIRRMVWKVK